LTAAHVVPVAHSVSASQRLQTATLPRARVPHTFVIWLQLLAPQSVASVATVQARHVPTTQRGVPARCPQSESIVHAAHVLAAVSQRLAATLEQSMFLSH
jgi:hypothetical protein